MDRYTINQIRSELERKREQPFTDEEFGHLLDSFRAHITRKGWYERHAVSVAIKRGWMSVKMAKYFKTYALE